MCVPADLTHHCFLLLCKNYGSVVDTFYHKAFHVVLHDLLLVPFFFFHCDRIYDGSLYTEEWKLFRFGILEGAVHPVSEGMEAETTLSMVVADGALDS